MRTLLAAAIFVLISSRADALILDCNESITKTFHVRQPVTGDVATSNCLDDRFTMVLEKGAVVSGNVFVASDMLLYVDGGVVQGTVRTVNGSLDMHSGFIADGVELRQLNLVGGRINGTVEGSEFSKATITGGFFEDIRTHQGTFVGRELALDGQPVTYGYWDPYRGNLTGWTLMGTRIDGHIDVEAGVFKLAGDLTGDNFVDSADLNLLGTQWQTERYGGADLNGDFVVDAKDLNIIAQSWQEGNFQPALSAVPEPSGSLLLLMGMMALILGRN